MLVYIINCCHMVIERMEGLSQSSIGAVHNFDSQLFINFGLGHRSEVVGRPLAALLANDGARVLSVDIDSIQVRARSRLASAFIHQFLSRNTPNVHMPPPLARHYLLVICHSRDTTLGTSYTLAHFPCKNVWQFPTSSSPLFLVHHIKSRRNG